MGAYRWSTSETKCTKKDETSETRGLDQKVRASRLMYVYTYIFTYVSTVITYVYTVFTYVFTVFTYVFKYVYTVFTYV